MLKYILKRLGLMLITISIITIIVFVFIHLLPDYEQPQINIDPKRFEMIREREGYNKPIPVQFYYWVRNIVKDGDFGYSTRLNRDSVEVLKERIPVSVSVNIYPFLISIPLGFGLGIIAALKKNKLTDHLISLGVVIFISVPGFALATLLQYYFGYAWEILPPYRAARIDLVANPSLRYTSLILPILAMTFGSVASYTRYTRAELTEVITSEFMLLCRTKGLTRSQATLRHALRNSMVPIFPMIIGSFVSILSGSLIVERIFRIPGIGDIYIKSFTDRDYPLIMVLMVFYTVVGLLTTLLVDISYSIVDPRIRVGGGKREQ